MCNSDGRDRDVRDRDVRDRDALDYARAGIEYVTKVRMKSNIRNSETRT